MKSIKTKLIIYFGLLLIITTVTISAIGFINSLEGMKELQTQLLNKKLKADIASADMYVKDYFGHISYKNDTLVDENNQNIKGKNKMVDAILDDLGDVATIFVKTEDDFKRITTNIMTDEGNRAVGTYLGKDSAAYPKVMDGKLYLGKADILGKSYSTAYDPIKDEDGKVIGILFIGVSEEETKAFISNETFKIRNNFIKTTAIAVLLSGIIVYIIGKGISRPIVNLSNSIKKLSNYDLTKDNKKINKYINRNDEVGTITKALLNMQDNFINLIKDISKTSQQVAASSEELTANSEQTATTSEEVSNTIEEISKGAYDQAKDTEKGVVHIDELGKEIEKNQGNVNELNKAIKEVNEHKNEGFTILEELNEKTEINNKSSKEIKDIILNTNESAKQISTTSEMIRKIAEQTNILSLNASIEAAKGGEAGKSFLVVADEIGKLAEQSNELSKDITKITSELTKKTDRAVNTMERVSKVVTEQTESVDKTNSKFEGISDSIEKIKKVIVSINDSDNKMQIKRDEIIDIIQNLSAISEENAAGTEEITASIEEQTASIDEIANASEALAKLAEEMQNNINKFKY
ncbi:MAG: methyl-accepting chemotaxis protein [Firmicutes bacterium]|nr:methyl-accepting chemotaxis protein [Bacillota bacterium]